MLSNLCSNYTYINDWMWRYNIYCNFMELDEYKETHEEKNELVNINFFIRSYLYGLIIIAYVFFCIMDLMAQQKLLAQNTSNILLRI